MSNQEQLDKQALTELRDIAKKVHWATIHQTTFFRQLSTTLHGHPFRRVTCR